MARCREKDESWSRYFEIRKGTKRALVPEGAGKGKTGFEIKTEWFGKQTEIHVKRKNRPIHGIWKRKS